MSKLVFVFLFLFVSCTKVGYLIDQGIGQVKLLNRAKENHLVLKDPLVKEAHKEKIRKIQIYKDYFYDYFQREHSDIYNKTTILDSKAVTYLIIASPFHEMKPIKNCFPLMGCFPYLGFFAESSAVEFQESLEKKGHYTFKRPVYAYSTLGYFTDPILSSFFNYKDYDLAELIFHELFHTILFIKNEVKFNENLANYFGQEMAKEYFAINGSLDSDHETKLANQKKLRLEMVKLAREYASVLKEKKPETREASDKLLKNFKEGKLEPKLSSLCEKLNVTKCRILERNWNNASMSAYLTYEDKLSKIEKIRQDKKLSLKEYFEFITNEYKNYSGKKFSKDFFQKYLGS